MLQNAVAVRGKCKSRERSGEGEKRSHQCLCLLAQAVVALSEVAGIFQRCPCDHGLQRVAHLHTTRSGGSVILLLEHQMHT